MRIEQEFKNTAAEFPNNAALRYGERVMTYEELDRKSDKLASAILEALGHGPETVTTVLPFWSWHISLMGILKAGKVAVQLRPHQATCERNSQVDYIDSRLAIMWAEDTLVIGRTVPDWLTENDGCYVEFTSGSTGSPKSVMHYHGGKVALARHDIQTRGIVPEDRIGQYRPGMASYRSVFAAWLAGATVCCWDGSEPLDQWVNREQITILNVDSTTYRILMLAGKTFPFVRVIDVGGEAVDREDCELYKQRFSDECAFISRYALSETHLVSEQWLTKKSTPASGRLPVLFRFPPNDIEIVDREIAVHTPWMASGYFNDPRLTEKKFIFRGGKLWYLTGDIGYERDGLLYIEGRKDLLP